MYVHRVLKLYRGLFKGKLTEFEIIRHDLKDLINLVKSSISLKDEGEIIIYEIDLKTKKERILRTILVCNELHEIKSRALFGFQCF